MNALKKKTKCYVYTRVSTAIQIILNIYKNGLAAEQIASVTGKDIKEVKVIIAGKKTELA